MNRLVSTPAFERAYRKFVRRNRRLQETIDAALRKLEQDVADPSLGTHKLSGALHGLWACACGYDCRIVFFLESDPETGGQRIVLVDIGTHDAVY